MFIYSLFMKCLFYLLTAGKILYLIFLFLKEIKIMHSSLPGHFFQKYYTYHYIICSLIVKILLYLEWNMIDFA